MVYCNPQPGSATRALIIGVGHYPALPGGGGTQFSTPEGMRHLQSPPASARAVAQCLVEHYESATRPLASVRLLVSEATAQQFVYSREGQQVAIEPPRADMAAVRTAILDWEKESRNVDDLMLFYFCGHGVANPASMALLLSDFGVTPRAPFSGALDFTRLRRGMEDCQAGQQCYFIDPCRLNSSLLKQDAYAGDSVIQPTMATPPGGLVCTTPTFCSTLAGDASYGRPGRASVFTEALIESLGGLAVGQEDGQDWTVKTTRLQASLQFLIDESILVNDWDVTQQPIVDMLQDLPLNTLTQLPAVPVVVTVDPSEAHGEAALRYDDGNGNADHRPADMNPWRLRLPLGRYSFHADGTRL